MNRQKSAERTRRAAVTAQYLDQSFGGATVLSRLPRQNGEVATRLEVVSGGVVPARTRR